MSTSTLQKVGAIYYGDQRIDFDIQPRISKYHKIRIQVHADKRVVVQAPVNSEHDDIVDAVKKRSHWIHKQLATFSDYHAQLLPRHYVSGESHFYLGRRHMLKVQLSTDNQKDVKLFRGVLKVSTPIKTSDKVKSLLINWYKKRAKIVFERRIEKLLTRTPWIKKAPQIKLRLMLTRWGSCSPAGVIVLNPHLVKAPTACIDYVLLHELCHITEHNHSEHFYKLLNKTMPDWQRIKTSLDNMAYFYLNDE